LDHAKQLIGMGFERDKVSWAPNMNPLFVEGKLSMVRVFKGQLPT